MNDLLKALFRSENKMRKLIERSRTLRNYVAFSLDISFNNRHFFPKQKKTQNIMIYLKKYLLLNKISTKIFTIQLAFTAHYVSNGCCGRSL